MCVPAKSGEGPTTHWRAAGHPEKPGNARRMPQGTLADSRARPGPLQRLAKSSVLSGGQQGPARVLSKAQRKPRDSLEGRRALPRLWQNMEKDQGNSGEKQGSSQQSPAKDLGHSGGQQGPARALAKPTKSPGEHWRSAGFLEHPGKGLCWGEGVCGALHLLYHPILNLTYPLILARAQVQNGDPPPRASHTEAARTKSC